jgi:hypothetical protein
MVKQEVVSIGFPESTLNQLFAPEAIEKISGKQISISCPLSDMSDYQEWFDAQPLSVSAPTVGNGNGVFSAHSPAGSGTESIIKQLREFYIEDSSPVECMCFAFVL